MSLADARLQTLVWSSNIPRSQQFYSDVLGLPLTGSSHGALVYRVGQGSPRVSPVQLTTSSEHTVIGFEVADFGRAVADLTSKGVSFERFPGFAHDEAGAWAAPVGTKVAWFRDPDGNLISLVRYAA
ncbi:MAG TPA: VOC family protein [Sphingomicrobium sp.]|nr:VOC family protein [Sphingomicrobium sp.]